MGRILLTLILILAVLATGILGAGAIAKSRLRAQFPPPGQLVDIGGYRLHLFCQGSGSPTVIMEAGAGDFGPIWALVSSQIARTTRACVYDRAGRGWSDRSPKPRTADVIVDELHTLITRAGLSGPYVLVGHSLGGLTMRLYAHRYPDGVAGMVLVDSAHEEQMQRFPAEIVRVQQHFQQQLTGQLRMARFLIRSGVGALAPSRVPVDPRLPPGAGSQYRALAVIDTRFVDGVLGEWAGIEESLAQVRAARITTLGDVPLIVLAHGHLDPFPPNITVAPEVIEQEEQVWREMQAELAGLSPRGRLVVAERSGHYIQLDQPVVVIDAITQVVAMAR